MANIIITLNGRQITIEPKATIKEVRVQFEIPEDQNVWKMDVPPKKLRVDYHIQDGDQLVTRTKDQVVE